MEVGSGSGVCILPGSKKIHKIILSWKLFWWPIFIFLLFLTNIKTKCLNMVLWMIKIVFETEFFSLLIHKTCLNQTSLEPSFLFEIDRCLVYTGYITGAWFIQIILTCIFLDPGRAGYMYFHHCILCM
jgi:hypothetical protein